MDTKKYDELTASLNVVRSHYQNQSFSAKEIVEKIKFIGINKNYVHVLVKNGIIIKESRGNYCFPSNPVYWNYVKKSLDEMHEIQQKYQKNYITKKQEKTVDTTANSNDTLTKFIQENNISLDEIAKYLVSTGNYRIEKKTVTWNQL